MNFLAHAYFSGDDAELMLGNISGDFVKGAIDKTNYTPGIKQGLILHRKIDALADKHATRAITKKRLRPELSRYAPVILDLFADHFLANNWQLYSDMPLSIYTHNIYRTINLNRRKLPAGFLHIVPYLIHDDWLTSYKDMESIGYALSRISYRLRRYVNLELAMIDLINDYEGFKADTLCLLNDLCHELLNKTKT